MTRAAPAPAARAPVKVALELWEMGGAEVVDATYVLMRVLVVVSPGHGSTDGRLLFDVLQREDARCR